MRYHLAWITGSLAVGHAPMSYAELDSIREQGVSAILNLCGEFSDLHEIETINGFDVYFLPIADESAPDMEEMEKALAWLDEAVYLGKKVLVHCRHGIGRTGTLVSAYLLRKGLGLKVVGRKLRHTRAGPTNYAQWRLLKTYGRQAGRLTIREPSLESGPVVDLADYWGEYEGLVREVETRIGRLRTTADLERCGADTDSCCRRDFQMKLIEALYLANRMNTTLTSDQRRRAIHRAVAVSRAMRTLAREDGEAGLRGGMDEIYTTAGLLCPLSVERRCILYEYRPIRCRSAGMPAGIVDDLPVEEILSNISRNVFFALSGVLPGPEELLFNCPDTISGRFTQIYFHYLAAC